MPKLVFFYLIIILLACNQKKESIRPVKKSITETVYASGILLSKNQYNVYATVNGIVDKLFLEEGNTVRPGSPILAIKNDEQDITQRNARLTSEFNALSNNEERLKEAQALIDLAKSKKENDALLLQRQKELWTQHIGSRVELEQRELAYENSLANYQSAKLKYEELNKQLKFQARQSANNYLISSKVKADYIVQSKINGKVYQLNIEEGELVNPQKPLAIIGDAEEFKLEMQVDEYDIVRIKPGMLVAVALTSYKDTVYSAKVTKINPIMNVQSKSFTVEAEFINPPPILYPNISFEANILVRKKEDVMLIPLSYLFNDTTVLDVNGKSINIKTGLRDYEMVEVLTGIDMQTVLIKPEL